MNPISWPLGFKRGRLMDDFARAAAQRAYT